MIELKLTEAEANALVQLLDAAVKAIGLNAAEAGLALAHKINAARAAAAREQPAPQANAPV